MEQWANMTRVCSNHFSRPSPLESSVCPRIQLFADQFLYNLEGRATRELDQICGVGYQEASDKEVILTQTERLVEIEKQIMKFMQLSML